MRTNMFKPFAAGTALVLLLAACQQQAAAPLSLTPWQPEATFETDQLRFLPAENNSADHVLASEKSGLAVMDAQGKPLATQHGAFNGLDLRLQQNDLLLATFDRNQRKARVQHFNLESRQWSEPRYLPTQSFAVETLCLGRDLQGHLFLFLLGEEGEGEQWLVGHNERVLTKPLQVRRMVLPPAAESCQVDDSTQQLYVNESGTGLWQFAIDPETDLQRQAVAMRAPFGDLKEGANAVAIVPGGVAVVDQEAATLHLYRHSENGWQNAGQQLLNRLAQPQELALRWQQGKLDLWLRDDDSGRQWQGQLPWLHNAVGPQAPLPTVPASVQTDPVSRPGDAADDPAIWIHPDDPTRSLVLGTNKQEGLLVYGLDGQLRQSLPVGRVNNVDVRSGLKLDAVHPDTLIDIAVASNRDHNSLSLFTIDRASGELTAAGEIPTPLSDVYGTCLFQPSASELHAFVNDKNGIWLQYRLHLRNDTWQGEQVRRFSVQSQPEACVADDAGQRLFIGEEDTGVWWLDARAEVPAQLHSVIRVGGVLHADVEGLGLYHQDGASLLVISSQGNNSYVVLDAQPPFALKGVFRVGMNVAAGIDGVSETDGLEVTSTNLGGAFNTGLLVVQDGRKRLPDGTQNFKLVPWQAVADVLKTHSQNSTEVSHAQQSR